MLGLSVLYRSKRFDYIVSGINRGDNLGLHVVYSGTVAGAREGAMRTGAVGVAVSLAAFLTAVASLPAWSPNRLAAGLFRVRHPVELTFAGPDALFARLSREQPTERSEGG